MPNNSQKTIQLFKYRKRYLINYRDLYNLIAHKGYRPTWWAQYEVNHFKLKKGKDYFIKGLGRQKIDSVSPKRYSGYRKLYLFTLEAAKEIVMHNYCYPKRVNCQMILFFLSTQKKGGML